MKRAGWVRNPVDRFVLARLEREGLAPSPEADRITQLRRLSFDLTGLPPTPAEIDAFIKDKSQDAYEKLVDRLLASPHYGERMAMQWLDLARYADTHGYHIDSDRDMWPWRDWVIGPSTAICRSTSSPSSNSPAISCRRNADQKIASGFNRNHMINFEGGAIPRNILNGYLVDRVERHRRRCSWDSPGLRAAMPRSQVRPVLAEKFYSMQAFDKRNRLERTRRELGNASRI